MMTIEQAKQAVKLNDEREALIKCANKIRMADELYFSAKEKWESGRHYGSREPVTLEVEVFADEFRALVTKELKAQVVKRDKQLRDLGVEPDPFEEAAPATTKAA